MTLHVDDRAGGGPFVSTGFYGGTSVANPRQSVQASPSQSSLAPHEDARRARSKGGNNQMGDGDNIILGQANYETHMTQIHVNGGPADPGFFVNIERPNSEAISATASGAGSSAISAEAIGEAWTGVSGLSNYLNGRGVVGGALGLEGVGVEGSASGNVGYGVRGVSAGAQGKGVVGEASGDSGANVGVHGETHSGNGIGVQGVNDAGAGGIAVVGTGGQSGIGIAGFGGGFGAVGWSAHTGVWAIGPSQGDGQALLVDGKLSVNGPAYLSLAGPTPPVNDLEPGFMTFQFDEAANALKVLVRDVHGTVKTGEVRLT
jgi:hypothetical protein